VIAVSLSELCCGGEGCRPRCGRRWRRIAGVPGYQPVAARRAQRFPQRGHLTRPASRRLRRAQSLQRSRSTNSTGASQCRHRREQRTHRPSSGHNTRRPPQPGQSLSGRRVGASPVVASTQVTVWFADPRGRSVGSPVSDASCSDRGIDRPRRGAAVSLTAAGVDFVGIGCATGVVSTSNRSLGVHCRADRAHRISPGVLVSNSSPMGSGQCSGWRVPVVARRRVSAAAW
jgi:hypothetical protein